MELEDNLTHLQKVALKGEIAFALSSSSHDAEMKMRIYLILKDVEEEYKPFILDAVKEAVNFPEEEVDKIYLETLSNKVPVWLWVNNAIADMKASITLGETSYFGPSLSINKKKERKKLVESAFVFFARKATIISPLACSQLLNSILEDYDLEFLHASCLYLKEGCAEIEAFKEDTDVPPDIFKCEFDIREMLSLRMETDALNSLKEGYTKELSVHQKYRKANKTKEVIVEKSISQEELSDFLSQKIAELFEGVTEPSRPSKPTNNTYVVKKVFTDSGMSTPIRVCKTKKEAEEFIQKIREEYPELEKTCKFEIKTVKNND